MAAACAALATSKRTAGKGLAEVVCCPRATACRRPRRLRRRLARAGAPRPAKGRLLFKRQHGRELERGHGRTRALRRARSPPGRPQHDGERAAVAARRECLFGAVRPFAHAVRGRVHEGDAPRGDDVGGRRVRRLQDPARLADTTSSYTGESAARLVDVVGDVLVQALSVTFRCAKSMPAYYLPTRRGRHLRYGRDGESTQGGQGGRGRDAHGRAVGARGPRRYDGAAACGGARSSARTRRFDGIVAVPAAVTLPRRRPAQRARAGGGLGPRGDRGRGGHGRRPVPEVKPWSGASRSSTLSPRPAARAAGPPSTSKTPGPSSGLARRSCRVGSPTPCMIAAASTAGRRWRRSFTTTCLPRILLAAMARVPTVTASAGRGRRARRRRQRARGRVCPLLRGRAAALRAARRARGPRGADAGLRSARAVAAIEMLADVTSRRPASGGGPGVARVTGAVLARARAAAHGHGGATAAQALEADRRPGAAAAGKIKSIEEFFADPVADKKNLSIRTTTTSAWAEARGLQSPDERDQRAPSPVTVPASRVAKVPAGQGQGGHPRAHRVRGARAKDRHVRHAGGPAAAVGTATTGDSSTAKTGLVSTTSRRRNAHLSSDVRSNQCLY